MAEFVEFRQERMLPCYEEMKKKQVFGDDELRKLKKLREGHDYKISKQGKTIRDFVEYIEFERKLLSLLTEREKSRDQKFTSIQYSVANHIKGLYKQALSLFPSECKLWDAFIKFCKHSKLVPEVSRAFEKMIQYHGDKPETWLRAAMWEYHETENMERVKDLFLRGLQRHPQNTTLFVQFFKVLLADTAKLSTEFTLEDNTESAQSLGLKRLEVIYKNSKKKIHDIEFLNDLLKVSEEYPFTKSLQKVIIEDMMKNYTKDEFAWHILAQRELRGFHMSDFSGESKEDSQEESESGETKKDAPNGFLKRTLRRRIELCCDVYETAIKTCNTEKMWTLFINAMLELNEDMSSQPNLKRKKLGVTLKAAHEARCMSEDHYYWYINLLSESNSNDTLVLEILEKATNLHPTSIKLWEQFLYFFIKLNDEAKIEETFRKGTKELGTKGHSLWRITLQYYQSRPELNKKADEIFLEACHQAAPSFGPFKAQYIEWIAKNKNIEKARNVYEELTVYPPPSLELHQKMAELESQNPNPDISKLRKCHEYATHFFGKTQTDVWIDFLKFERKHGEAKRGTLLYERAKEALTDELVDSFITEYCLLKL